MKSGTSTKGREERERVIIDLVGRVIVLFDHPLRAKLIFEAHELLFCGYFGVKKMAGAVARSWWWPEMNKDVERAMGTYDVCQRAQSSRKKDEAPIEVIVVEGP